MKVNLPHVLKLLRHDCPAFSAVLEDIERHLRELIAGEHTLQEFAEHYCLTDKRAALSSTDGAMR